MKTGSKSTRAKDAVARAAPQRASPAHRPVDQVADARPAPLEACPAHLRPARVAQDQDHPASEQKDAAGPRQGCQRRRADPQQEAKHQLEDSRNGMAVTHGGDVAPVCCKDKTLDQWFAAVAKRV